MKEIPIGAMLLDTLNILRDTLNADVAEAQRLFHALPTEVQDGPASEVIDLLLKALESSALMIRGLRLIRDLLVEKLKKAEEPTIHLAVSNN